MYLSLTQLLKKIGAASGNKDSRFGLIVGWSVGQYSVSPEDLQHLPA